jgi:RNA polymerase sigma-70 factor (ECF subfamily)
MSAETMNERTIEEGSNEAKLTSLYEEYYDKIAHYAYVRIGNKTEAEDIAGEVFLRALDSSKSYKERGIPMQAWLFRIARNLVVDHYRKMAKQKTIPIDTIQVTADTNPITVAEANIELGRVMKAMEGLTREQREVVELRLFGGLTSKETGSIVKKSDGAVREMQRASIEKLRKLLVTE